MSSVVGAVPRNPDVKIVVEGDYFIVQGCVTYQGTSHDLCVKTGLSAGERESCAMDVVFRDMIKEVVASLQSNSEVLERVGQVVGGLEHVVFSMNLPEAPARVAGRTHQQALYVFRRENPASDLGEGLTHLSLSSLLEPDRKLFEGILQKIVDKICAESVSFRRP